MGKLSLWTVVIGVLLAGSPFSSIARADDVSAAREHYRRGTTLFDLQKYIEAAHEYELAFEAKEDPALLYNIAQSYRLGGEAAKALGAYKSFLRRVPKPPNREEVTSRIFELQKLVDQQKHTQEAPPVSTMPVETKGGGGTEPATPRPNTTTPPPTTTPETTPPATTVAPAETATPPAVAVTPVDAHPGRTKKLVGIGAGAVGIVCLVVGIVMEVLAKNASDSITNAAPNTVFNPSTESTVKTDSAAGVAMLVVGGVGVAAGATLFVLGHREAQRARRVAVVPAFGREGGMVFLRGSF
jgi:hypothetical protein